MNKRITALLLLSVSLPAMGNSEMMHSNHPDDRFVDGGKLDVTDDQLSEFTAGLEGSQVAIISVMGMVCDFCARGIEKTFQRDKSVQKIDVDLANGKVLIAYVGGTQIDADKINQQILSNGQNVTGIQVIEI